MSKENVALVKAIYDAFGVGDVPGVLGRMSPDIVWNEAENFPYADRNPYVGPQAVPEGVFGRVLAEWEGFQVAPDEILDAGDAVVMLGRYLGTLQGDGQAPAAADRSRLAREGRQGNAVPAICRHAPRGAR